MKKILVCLIFLGLYSIGKAQSPSEPSKAEQQVAQVVEKLRLAMISGNKTELESVLTDDLSYGHSGGNIQDKAAFVDAITTKKSDFKTIELTKQSITVQDNIAVVRHILSADTNDGGKPGHVNLGIVLVLKKSGKDWKVMARRAFKVPE